MTTEVANQEKQIPPRELTSFSFGQRICKLHHSLSNKADDAALVNSFAISLFWIQERSGTQVRVTLFRKEIVCVCVCLRRCASRVGFELCQVCD